MTGHGRVDVERSGLPAGEIELRVFGSGRYYGRFMLEPEPGSKPSLQARMVAVTLADQAGRAFKRRRRGRRERALMYGPRGEALPGCRLWWRCWRSLAGRR